MSRHNRNFKFLAFFLSVALSAVQVLPVYGQETEPEDAKPPEVTEQGSSENNLSEPDPQAVPSDSSDSESAQKESELPEEKTENSQDGTDQNSNSPSDSSEANTQDDVKPPAVENNAESVREEEPPADRSENTELEKENKNNQNLYTLSASEGALKLSVKGSFDTKPDEIKMKIEKIPADAEHEKKLTSSLFAKDEKVSLYGFRITWMTEDGRNIIPENPEFTLDFDLNEAGFPQDAVTSSILKETGGQAAVIIDESTGLTRTDQKLHAEFSTIDLENLYVAAIQSDKEPSDAASVQNQFATSPKNETSEETTLSEKPETIEQTVYCYTVIPGVKVTPDGDCDSEWNGMGIGLVTGAPKAHSVPLNSDVNYLHLLGIHLVKPAELPDLSPNNRYPDSYPPITAVSGKSGETKVYKYAAPNSGNEHTYGYYTIDWDQLVMSDGANAGHNGYNPTVSYYQPTWHLNGVVYLNQEEYVSIGFYLKEAGSENWQNISAIRAPTGTTERKIFEDNEVPLMDSEQYPEYKIVNGIGYRLVYWSDEQNMSNPHRLDQDIPITDNTAFYAAYIPEPSKNLKITKQVEGQFADPDQEFEFSMQVHWKNKNWNPAAADIEKYDIQYQDGNYVFKLKAGQTLSLQIPQDAVISVTENLPAHSGYVSEVMRNGRPTDQKNDSFHLTEDTQMLFTNIRQSSEVFFKFRDFDQTEFKLISSVKIPADTTTGMWLENEKLIPSLAQYPQTRILNGQIDHLVFWSENDRLENAKAVSEYGRLQDGQIFYAGYLPVDMHQFSIYKTVSGAGINPDQEFQFEISLSFNGQPFDLNENQLALSKWRKLATGKYSLSLKANEKSLISLPEGVHIHIDEQNAEELGFASNIYVDGQELKNPYDAEIMKDSLVEYHNEKQQWIIDFMFRSAGADKYQLLKSLKVPAATTTEEDLLTQELVPDLASCPEREIKNGTAYHLVYWSENENLQNVTDLKSRKLLRDHEVFYAGYLPEKTQNLKISKSVTGAIMDPDKSFEFNIRILWENIPYELTENQLEKTGWQKTGEGEYRLSLKNGEDTQIDLPYNARISVMESEKSSLGFKTSVFVNDKKNETCSEVILNQDTEIRFINEKLDWKINFFLRNAGETDWQLLKSVKVPAETSTQQTLLDEHLVPDLSAYPEARVVDGIIYHLKFWSDDMDLTSPGSFNNTKPLSDNENFYAGYVADEVKTLTILKKVDGRHYEDPDYKFHIMLSFENQPFVLSQSELKKSGWNEEEPGTYSFSLKENESSSANLPAGIQWKVKEADYASSGYITSIEGSDQSVQEDQTQGILNENTTVEFTNTKQQWDVEFKFKNPNEDWKLIKQVSIPAQTSTSKTLVELGVIPSLAGKPAMLVENGVVYDLKTWSETEDLNDPVHFDESFELYNKEVFYAGYIPRTTYPLTVKKSVKGEGANPENEYSFSIQFLIGCHPYDPDSKSIKQAGFTKVDQGVYRFSLKNEQSITMDLPQGVQISIDEDDYSKKGFLSMINVNGEQKSDPWCGTLNTPTHVEYINIKQQWTVSFRFQNINESDWTTLKTVSVPADTSTEEMLVKNGQVPELSDYPMTVTADGEIYHRKAWSNQPDLSDPHSLDQKTLLRNGEVFYGGYVPESKDSLIVCKHVEGTGFDPNRKYDFFMTLSYEGKPFDLSDAQISANKLKRSKPGVYSFDLLNEERMDLRIPKGVLVSVSESEESSNGFETSLEVNNQKQDAPYSNVMTEETKLDFINRKQQWKIEFDFKDAGSSSYRKLTEVSVPAKTSTQKTLLNDHLVPALDQYPEFKIAEGKAWHLVCWSQNQQLTDPSNLKNDTPLKNNQIFYAGYIPVSENRISIKKTVEGIVSEPDRLYEFNVRITWASNPFDLSKSALDAAGWQQNGPGEYHLSLKNNQTSQISLPKNARVYISEADYSQIGFETILLVNGQESQTPFEKDLNEDTELEFINKKDQWNVSFWFMDAGSRTWNLLKTAEVPARTSIQQTLLNMHLAPDLSGYPETKVANGMVYHLRFWSENRQLRDLTDLNNSDPLSNHEDFYAGYVADELKSLTIAKKVEGNHLDAGRQFKFTVSLDEMNQPFELSKEELRQSGWIKSAEGIYTVYLKENQSSTALLPAGIHWSVQEEDCRSIGYETTAKINGTKADLKEQKQILNENSLIEFTNRKKQWEVRFMFRDPGSSVFKQVSSVKIPAKTSMLKTLQNEKEIPDLSTKPKIIIENGTVYHLKTWSKDEGMESRVDFDSDQKLEDHETFYAGYVAGNEYDLNFEKEVTGFEDTRKEFDFTAVFSYEGQPFNPSDSLIRFANLHRQADGVYTFTAAPNQPIRFVELPENVIVQINENDYAAEGYQTSIVKNGEVITGRQTSVLMNKDSTLKFINKRKAWIIHFMLKEAASQEYGLLDSVEIPARSTIEDALVKAGDIPSLSKYPKTVMKDGRIWNLRFWSVHKNMSGAGSLDGDESVYNGETFYAAYVPVPMEALTISKNVVSVIPDEKAEFEFRLTLSWNDKPFELSPDTVSEFDMTKVQKGVYSFKLKNNQEKKEIPLPAGIQYQLEEIKTSGKLYSTLFMINGKTEEGSDTGPRRLDQIQKISFINWEKTIVVEFYLKNAAESEFRKIDTVTLPGQGYKEIDLVKRNLVPRLTKLPEYQVVDGKVYQIHYWYENQLMTVETTLDDERPVPDHKKYYAAYLPVEISTLMVTNRVEGNDVRKDQEFSFVIRLSENGKPYTEDLVPVCNVQDTDYNVFNDLKLLENQYSQKKSGDQNSDNMSGLRNIYNGAKVHNNKDGTYTFFLSNGQRAGPFILPDHLDFEVEEIDGFTDGFDTSYQLEQNAQDQKWISKDLTGTNDLCDQTAVHFLNIRNQEKPSPPSKPDQKDIDQPENKKDHPSENDLNGKGQSDRQKLGKPQNKKPTEATSADLGTRVLSLLGVLSLLVMILIGWIGFNRKKE